MKTDAARLEIEADELETQSTYHQDFFEYLEEIERMRAEDYKRWELAENVDQEQFDVNVEQLHSDCFSDAWARRGHALSQDCFHLFVTKCPVCALLSQKVTFIFNFNILFI